MPHQIGHKNLFDNNKSISVKSEDTDSFIKKQINKNINGVSDTDITTLDPSLGALAPFVNQATKILDSVYASTSEPTQREKDINMGRAALKFFTTFGAQSSVPGATALGAANQAGALVAKDYLAQESKKESDAKKLEQAKKSTALSLGMQLKTAKDAKDIAELKAKNVKPGTPKQYKMVNAKAVVKALGLPLKNPRTNEFYKNGDVIDLLPTEFNAVPRGNLASFKEITPPKPGIYERLRDNVVKDFQIFNTEGKLPPGGITTILANITELKDSKFVPIPDPSDPSKIVYTLQQGVNMFDILEKEFGKEAVDKLKKIAEVGTVDTIIPDVSDDKSEGKDEKNNFKTINVGGTKFTILSSKESKLNATEVKSLTDAESGLKDVQRAIELIFPNGKYNRKLVAAMNLSPDWGLGAMEFLDPGGLSGNALTVLDSMKRAIELILRARSGAAVPPAELENYLKLYLPSTINNELQAKNKIDSLLNFFKGTIDGLNKGRQKGGSNEDDSFFNKKLPVKVESKAMVDGGKVMGRLLKKQGEIMYIETKPGSGLFQPLVTKSK